MRRRLPPDERRELILQSAARLFTVLPYSQVSTTDIAREAGITRGLLNHYFTDKRGLYLEVVRRAVLLPTFEQTPESVAIPEFLVDAVVEAPGGAWPFSCTPLYEYDGEYLAEWVSVARDPEEARRFIAERIVGRAAAVV